MFQIAQRFFVVADDHCYFFAGFQFAAVAAGFITLLQSALTDWTKGIAVWRFHSVNTAAFAIYHFRSDFNVIQFRPFFCNLLAPSWEETFAQIAKTTPQQLFEIANALFLPEKLYILTYE